jgi:integrase
MVKTTFKPTAIQFLYRREPIGVYYARLYVRGGNKWISLRTKTFSVAKLALHKHLSHTYAVQDAKTAIAIGKATMGDLAKVYLEGVELNGAIKDSTKQYRAKTIKYLFRSWQGLEETAPAKVNETECRHWAAEYRAKFSETLYNNTLDSVRHLFDLAIERGTIARNPATRIEKVRVLQKKLELPSRAEFHAIVAEVRSAGSGYSTGDGDLVEFLAYSGLRATEASSVRWQDVDLERGRIYVAPGKNSNSRIVPILEPMRDLLTRIQAEPRWFKNETRRKAGCVLSVVECEKALTAACARVGVERLTRHDLRHLYATRCIEAGVDIPTVSRWLGHRDGGALAMRTYGHLRDEHSQAMAAKVLF